LRKVFLKPLEAAGVFSSWLHFGDHVYFTVARLERSHCVLNSGQCGIQSLPQTFLIRETFDLREQVLLESTESCKFSCGLLVHRGKDSLVECSPPDVLAHRQARSVGLVSDDGFLSSVMRISIRNVAPLFVWNLPLSSPDSVGSRGVALSKMRNHFSE
jgi:hypothetical protein